MNLLAFDTSTEILSIALGRDLRGSARVWQHTGAGGAQASTTLLPAVLALMDQAGLHFGQLDAIAFGRGPGSFTGLRTACSVAQGLAFGGGARAGRQQGLPLLPVDTLLAVAEEAREHQGATRVLALLDARMAQVYASSFEYGSGRWTRCSEPALQSPEQIEVGPGWTLAGNVFAAYGERLPPGGPRIEALPTASALLRLAPALLDAGLGVSAEQALPLYIRDKVAQTTEERAADRAARQAVAP
ncbi:MAG: tRNA (adenosine(37)-N6)-threonylcarbamoyltransferase complex dimerization subunit type 1 TsaB [Burkholderiaceae bacterium]|nr:tRNA (adenosine(37)-N6)-threonylcarbamoyltransferase complex dimerization subunit type 1 TsaB [Burkholderiaceae bacterium]